MRPADARSHGRDRGSIDRIRRLAPFTPHVGEHAGDLLVVQCAAYRRHQSGGAFFAVHQDPYGNLRRGQRERGSDEARGDAIEPSPVRLVTARADVSIDFAAAIELLLLRRGQRARRSASPAFPGQVTRPSNAVALAPRSPFAAARSVSGFGSRVNRRTGALDRPVAVGQSAGRGNAYAPPGPARPPGHVGHGIAAELAARTGAGVPGIGAPASATSAPRRSAARCQSGRAESAVLWNNSITALSCPDLAMVASRILVVLAGLVRTRVGDQEIRRAVGVAGRPP